MKGLTAAVGSLLSAFLYPCHSSHRWLRMCHNSTPRKQCHLPQIFVDYIDMTTHSIENTNNILSIVHYPRPSLEFELKHPHPESSLLFLDTATRHDQYQLYAKKANTSAITLPNDAHHPESQKPQVVKALSNTQHTNKVPPTMKQKLANDQAPRRVIKKVTSGLLPWQWPKEVKIEFRQGIKPHLLLQSSLMKSIPIRKAIKQSRLNTMIQNERSIPLRQILECRPQRSPCQILVKVTKLGKRPIYLQSHWLCLHGGLFTQSLCKKR